MDTMGIMSAALGFDCVECHIGAGTDTVKWEADTDKKRTARRMTLMMAAINKTNFGERQVVTCWTCHRGRDIPSRCRRSTRVWRAAPRGRRDHQAVDSLAGRLPIRFSTNICRRSAVSSGCRSVTSYVATGTSEGFRGFGGGGTVQIFAKAPDQRATIIKFAQEHRAAGCHSRASTAAAAGCRRRSPSCPQYVLGGSELDGARIDAQLAFPAQIKKVLTQLRVGPPDYIDGRDVDVVQGNGSRGLVATLYFDKQSGLLVRMVRFGSSPIGRAPTQVDFADYRDVAGAGIKMPYRWTFGWLNGRDTLRTEGGASQCAGGCRGLRCLE